MRFHHYYFIIAMMPLSYIENAQGATNFLSPRKKINHLMCMDNIKLPVKNEEEKMENLI